MVTAPFISASLWEPSGFRSTFIILAIAGLPAPSAPWHDLHFVSKTALPAPASAARAATGINPLSPQRTLIGITYRKDNLITHYFQCSAPEAQRMGTLMFMPQAATAPR